MWLSQIGARNALEHGSLSRLTGKGYFRDDNDLMTFEEVRAALKQRFPMIMVDSVISLEPGKSIRTTKNVTGNEIQFLGHFPEHAVMPGTLIVEAIGQRADGQAQLRGRHARFSGVKRGCARSRTPARSNRV